MGPLQTQPKPHPAARQYARTTLYISKPTFSFRAPRIHSCPFAFSSLALLRPQTSSTSFSGMLVARCSDFKEHSDDNRRPLWHRSRHYPESSNALGTWSGSAPHGLIATTAANTHSKFLNPRHSGTCHRLTIAYGLQTNVVRWKLNDK